MSKPQQLVVTFAGGYIAGVLCAVASHPPDTVVSKLNANVGSSALKVAKALGWRGNRRSIKIRKEIFVSDVVTLFPRFSLVEGPWSQDHHGGQPHWFTVVHL